MRYMLPPQPNPNPHSPSPPSPSPPTPPTPPWCFHIRSGDAQRNPVPMSRCCPYSAIAAAPMGEKIKDMFQCNPHIHPQHTHTHTHTHTQTHMYIQAHQKHFLLIPSSHPLPPSDIKGISIETLMRGTHFKSNTLQSLYIKKKKKSSPLSRSHLLRVVFLSRVIYSGGFEAEVSGVSGNLTQWHTWFKKLF